MIPEVFFHGYLIVNLINVETLQRSLIKWLNAVQDLENCLPKCPNPVKGFGNCLLKCPNPVQDFGNWLLKCPNPAQDFAIWEDLFKDLMLILEYYGYKRNFEEQQFFL